MKALLGIFKGVEVLAYNPSYWGGRVRRKKTGDL
jgi:hypothetical protein